MPFIDSKVTVSVTEEQKEKIKSELGQAPQNKRFYNVNTSESDLKNVEQCRKIKRFNCGGM